MLFHGLFSVIITHTVGQMTEKSLGLEIGTQTTLPTASLNFSMLRPMNGTVHDKSDDSFDAQIIQNEMTLRNQMNALRQFDAELHNADEQYDSIESPQVEPNSVIFCDRTVLWVLYIFLNDRCLIL